MHACEIKRPRSQEPDIEPIRSELRPIRLASGRSRISAVLATRLSAPHAREPSKVWRGPLSDRTQEFKRLDGPIRQRSDCCCSSGTSSCQSEASAGAGRRAGAVGGQVVGSPRWPRILSITGFSSMKAMTFPASAAGTSEDILAKDAQEQLVPGNAGIDGTRRLGRGRRAGCVWRGARTWGWCQASTLRGRRYDLAAPLRGRPEDAVISHEVSPRRRDQRRGAGGAAPAVRG